MTNNVLILVILGQPITKKNSQQMVDIGRVCPLCKRKERSLPIQSAPYRKYEKEAKTQICFKGPLPALAGSVWVKTLYYLKTAREPDLTNLMAATHDILERAGVIENDGLIKSVDGSRIMPKDRQNPRCEITIQPYEEV